MEGYIIASSSFIFQYIWLVLSITKHLFYYLLFLVQQVGRFETSNLENEYILLNYHIVSYKILGLNL